MKILIACVTLIASCSLLPQPQTTKTTTIPSPKELRLDIPSASWEPIFFESIDERARLSKLESLRAGALPADDFEVRVWHGFGVTALEGFVLRRARGNWFAIHLEAVTRKVASNESDKNLPSPKSRWDGALRRLEEAGLFTLPDAWVVHCSTGINDGMSYVVEFNRDGVYRTYMYDNPDYAKCNEAKRMIQIGNIISEEFGVPEMATK